MIWIILKKILFIVGALIVLNILTFIRVNIFHPVNNDYIFLGLSLYKWIYILINIVTLIYLIVELF